MRLAKAFQPIQITAPMIQILLATSLSLLVLIAMPVALSAARYWQTANSEWWAADRSSAGLLPPARARSDSLVRVYSARTVRWKGIFAVHSWIVLKQGAGPYERYDLTAWGEPLRVNGFVPDGRWFGQVPSVIYAANGLAADALIPRMRAAITEYKYRHYGDYRAWPGPNSNTFVASVLAAVPEIGVSLPATAIGKDFPVDGRWVSLAPSRTGIHLSLGGYAGFTIAWVEGIDLNLLGAVIGIDLRHPALELPGLGRLGVSAQGERKLEAPKVVEPPYKDLQPSA
jgi:Protein of unknown function (DUF3750)